MIFNMNNAGITSNTIYNQTKVVLSQTINNSSSNKTKDKFIFKSKPSFSLSSANKNINYSKSKQTKND